MKTNFRTYWAAVLCIALLGAGCATYTNSNPRFVPPPVGDYYKGGTPDFASRLNPDPKSRKIRIGNIWIDTSFCRDFSNARDIVEHCSWSVANTFMPLREQSKNSTAFTAIEPPEWVAAIRNECIYAFYGVLFDQYKSQRPHDYKYVMASRSDLDFLSGYPTKDWLWHLNSELANRYPSLFSLSDDAFPVDVLLVMLYDGEGTYRRESLCEAWILGLPQHGSLTRNDCAMKGGVFKAEEGFTSPYDALAAAPFKLSEWQWEELQPSNPNDFAWLKCDVPASEINNRYRKALDKTAVFRIEDLKRKIIESSLKPEQKDKLLENFH